MSYFPCPKTSKFFGIVKYSVVSLIRCRNNVAEANGLRLSTISSVRVGVLIFTALLTCFARPAYSAVEILYGYDDLNRLESVVRSDGPRIDYYYDEVSNITDYQVTNSPYIQGNAAARFVAPNAVNDAIPAAFEGLEPYQ